MMNDYLQKLIVAEGLRQSQSINLIASENFASKDVRNAVGSVFMNKYSEGMIKKRYYEGNEVIDQLEIDTTDKLKRFMLQNDNQELFDEWSVNLQIPTGSIANLIVYSSVLEPNDTILSMFLPDGGHLSHGWSFDKGVSDPPFIHYSGSSKTTFVSKIYNIVQYKTDPITHLINYEKLREIALTVKPKLIITGGTAYCREIDYKTISDISHEVGAYYLADIAHEAGLIGAGVMKSPFAFADFVTFTTHKTLRGPRGAVVMCRKNFIEKVNKSVMPGLLGGPFNHSIAGLNQALSEALTEDFKSYAASVITNAKRLGTNLTELGYNLISGGTDKHLIVINLENKRIDGDTFSKLLAVNGIVSNKSTVPYETGSPMKPSGIRFGTPFITTRGFRENEIDTVAELIDEVMLNYHKNSQKNIKDKVIKLTNKFPLDI
jgi:glycine hydroxymethyltransferase